MHTQNVVLLRDIFEEIGSGKKAGKYGRRKAKRQKEQIPGEESCHDKHDDDHDIRGEKIDPHGAFGLPGVGESGRRVNDGGWPPGGVGADEPSADL